MFFSFKQKKPIGLTLELYHSFFFFFFFSENIFSVLVQVPEKTEPKAKVYVGCGLAHVKTGVGKKEMRWKEERASIRGYINKMDTT